MKLKTVVFYQGVKLWDGNLYQTVSSGKNRALEGVTIDLEEHVVYVRSPSHDEVIIVGTSNMREARFIVSGGQSEEDKATGKAASKIQVVSELLKTERITQEQAKEILEPVASLPEAVEQSFNPAKYAGKAAVEKVTKPKAQKAVK